MYKLEKYTSPNSRYTCPSCGQKRVFVRYVDEFDGRYLDPDCGRCNRESKCGYHYSPKEYFADHPERIERSEFQPRRKKAAKPRPRQDVSAIAFHSRKEFDASLNSYYLNPFAQFLLDLFPADGVKKVLDQYYVGWFENLTCFWQIDILGRIRKGKLMRYDRDSGKRQDVYNFEKDGEQVSIPVYWVHRILQKKKEISDKSNFQSCWFGEHLLRIDRNKTIGVVEAEKTAVICSICFPDLVWIAVGAQRHFDRDKLTVLRNRKVILYPDGDAFQVWSEKVLEMERFGIDAKISRAIEDNATQDQKLAGMDLADYVIDQQRTVLKVNEYGRSEPPALITHFPAQYAAVVQAVN